MLCCVHVPQAGILQGEVDSLMVMDQWQASLMRSLAQLQLRNSPAARSQVEEKFDMEDDLDFEEDELESSDGEESGDVEAEAGSSVPQPSPTQGSQQAK